MDVWDVDEFAAVREARITGKLTDGEFRKLGNAQGTLSELLDVTKVEKNDIIRAAMHRMREWQLYDE